MRRKVEKAKRRPARSDDASSHYLEEKKIHSRRPLPKSMIFLLAVGLCCVGLVILVVLIMFLFYIDSGGAERFSLEEKMLWTSLETDSYVDETKQKCSLSVVVFDPRLPLLDPSNSLWGAIESVIANGPQQGLCLILQTSACLLRAENKQRQTSVADKDLVKNAILARAPYPMFRSVLQGAHDGQNVRIAIIDHIKYQLNSCSDFWNPGHAWMNIQYWETEFTDDDSDLVLFIQDDTVLCRPLNPIVWSKFAFVGPPWPNRDRNVPSFPSLCGWMERKWKFWNEKPVPSFLCNGMSQVGNGGLSLRSRKWMIQAIKSCPYAPYSGLPNDIVEASSCRVKEAGLLSKVYFFITELGLHRKMKAEIPEDLYFATVLKGIGAPKPHPFEASLFASEMLLPEQIAEKFGPQDESLRKKLEQHYLEQALSDGTTQHRGKDRSNSMITPNGVHDLWRYRTEDEIIFMLETCPFLEKIIPRDFMPRPSLLRRTESTS